MLDELGAALERAADLNAVAISLWEGLPPSDGRAVMASALRENRDAMVRAGLALSAAWEKGFTAGRAFEREQAPSAKSPPELRLVVGG